MVPKSLKLALESGLLNLPDPTPLPGHSKSVPYVCTGDGTFPPSSLMMKPYPLQKIVCLIKDFQECGISPKMDWYSSELLEGVEECPFSLEPEKVRVIALATITLHNWLQKDSYGKVYIPSVSGLVDNEEVATAEITEGTWRKDPATES